MNTLQKYKYNYYYIIKYHSFILILNGKSSRLFIIKSGKKNVFDFVCSYFQLRLQEKHESPKGRT